MELVMFNKHIWIIILLLGLFGIVGCGEAPSKKANKGSETSLSKEQRQKLLDQQTKRIFRQFVEQNKPIAVDWDEPIRKASSNGSFGRYAPFFTITLQKALVENIDGQVLLWVSLKDIYEREGKRYGLFVSPDDTFRFLEEPLLYFELEVPDRQVEVLTKVTPPGPFTFKATRFLVAAKIDSVDKIRFEIKLNESDSSESQQRADAGIEMKVGNSFWVTGVASDLVHVPNDLQEEALKEANLNK